MLMLQAGTNIYYATRFLDVSLDFRMARAGGITKFMMADFSDAMANVAFYNGAYIIIIIGLMIGEIIAMMRKGRKIREGLQQS